MKLKVTYFGAIGTSIGTFFPDQIFEVPDSEGHALIQRKIAEEVIDEDSREGLGLQAGDEGTGRSSVHPHDSGRPINTQPKQIVTKPGRRPVK